MCVCIWIIKEHREREREGHLKLGNLLGGHGRRKHFLEGFLFSGEAIKGVRLRQAREPGNTHVRCMMRMHLKE